MTEPVDFLAVPLADGGVRVRLDRLTDGRIMCQLCFGFFHRAELNPVDGGVEDVCRPCAIEDAELTRRKRAGDSRPDPSSPEEAQNGPSGARTAPGSRCSCFEPRSDDDSHQHALVLRVPVRALRMHRPAARAGAVHRPANPQAHPTRLTPPPPGCRRAAGPTEGQAA